MSKNCETLWRMALETVKCIDYRWMQTLQYWCLYGCILHTLYPSTKQFKSDIWMRTMTLQMRKTWHLMNISMWMGDTDSNTFMVNTSLGKISRKAAERIFLDPGGLKNSCHREGSCYNRQVSSNFMAKKLVSLVLGA